MTPSDLETRRALLLEAAARHGCLREVPKQDAVNWQRAWGAARSALRPRPARVVPPNPAARPVAPAPPRPRPARPALKCDPALLVPGTWVAFRPHNTKACPETVARVVALVPPGVPLRDVLPPDALAHIERHAVVEGSSLASRVVVSVPGARRASGTYRTVLVGVLAARGRLAVPPEELRTLEPVPVGSVVPWSWHSSQGPRRHLGRILAYLPAGVSLRSVLPAVLVRDGVADVSNHDRYVVRLVEPRRKKIMTPAAHLIEREVLRSQKEVPCAT